MDNKIVKTEKTVFGGNTIAKVDNKTVFIPYTMPEETISINIVQHKNDYDNAEIINILEPSIHRVKPKCKYYEKCGGCNMMHIDSEYQRELRKQMLEDAFGNSKIDISDKINIIHGPDFNYRARFQFTDGGLSQKKSNQIIPLDRCECAEEPINEYLKNTPVNNRPSGRTHFFGSSKITDNQKLKISIPQVKEVHKIQGGKNSKKLKIKENNYFSGTILSLENIVTVQIADKKLSFDVRGFFQSNLFVFEKVLKKICDSLPQGKNVLDMYSGCGSISTFLADKFENVILVEHNRDALVFAEQNMAGKKHTSYGLSGADWVKRCASTCPTFDACVIDPPRSGMEKEVCDYLCNSKIPFIRYLSCDPATQARDAAKLINAGYKLDKIYLLDFYPNTSHIESLAIFNLES